MNKVLFVINGMGLGNATRSAALIALLKDDYQIDIASSGRAVEFFSKKSEVKLFCLKEISQRTNQGKIQPWKTLLLFPTALYRFISNSLFIISIIRKENYHFIVSDSDYTAILWKLCVKQPLIAINNSIWTKHVAKSKVVNSLFGHFHYFFERLDYFFHYYFADLVLCPMPLAITATGLKKFVFINPLTRKVEPAKLTVSTRPQVLVILSGSGLGIDENQIKEFETIPGVDFHIAGLAMPNVKNLFFYGFTDSLTDQYRNCDFVISNAGWSTICEIINYKKIGIIVPIKNHTEQMANALLVSHLPNIHITKKNELLLSIPKIIADCAHPYSSNKKPIADDFKKTTEIVSDFIREFYAQTTLF